MLLIDFLIGFFLMNAMPHFILGTWKQRMFSAFGFGNIQNIMYSVLNLSISIALFFYQYGAEHLATNGIYTGALCILVIYYLTGWFFRNLFQKEESLNELKNEN